MSTNAIRLHRVLRATSQRIYRAFLNADAMTKWLPPNGFTGKIHQLDAKVGGTYKMSFTNFSSGHSHSFGGEYLELVPHECIRHTDRFDDPNLSGQMVTTITLKAVSCGTELNVVQEGIPEAIPPEACYLGWQESLVLLGKLVEAEISEQWGAAQPFVPGEHRQAALARFLRARGAGDHAEDLVQELWLKLSSASATPIAALCAAAASSA